jgi:hypothetical protein
MKKNNRYLLYFFILSFPTLQVSTAQDFINVEARRRVTNSDGLVSYKAYEPFKTITIAQLHGFIATQDPSRISKSGGLKAKKGKATGFFHVEKNGDRWWCIDPEGFYYYNIAMNSISRGGSDRSKKALADKFGTPEKWMTETIGMLYKNGFTCAGSWSDYKSIIAANSTSEKPMAYTINLNFMSSYGKERGGTYQQPGHTGYPKDAIFVFDPDWEKFCDRQASQAAAYKNDPALFGYFSDNEMPFKLKSIDNYFSLPENDPGHIAAAEWLKQKGLTIEKVSDRDREEFIALVADKYFSSVARALKKYDPNHMYIGARFYSNEKNYQLFMATAGKYLDIVSNNYYNKWTPDSGDMANWTKWSGRPFIITEYYTKGEDSGMPNQSGAGWIVKTQRDRGLFYQNYCLALLRSKNCVGWHYFKYQDNDPTEKGVDPSNTDSNKGIVTALYEPWKPMLELMKELNTSVYELIDYFDKE